MRATSASCSLVVREHRRSAIEFWKGAPEILDFRYVVDGDVRLRWIMDQIILVVAFRAIETLERVNAGNDRPRKRMRLIELADVSLRNPLLAVIGVKNGRPILSADIG